jgi:hypothetical protein
MRTVTDPNASGSMVDRTMSLPAQQAGAGHGLVGEAAVWIERVHVDGGRTIDILRDGLPGRITSR